MTTVSHNVFIQSSPQDFLVDCHSLALVNMSFEHSCASYFSKVVALMYALTSIVSESLQMMSNAVFETVTFENCFQANRHKEMVSHCNFDLHFLEH